MTERHESFEVAERPRVEVRLGSAGVWVTEGEPNLVEVLVKGSNIERVTIDHFGDEIRIGEDRSRRMRGSLRLALRVPVTTTIETALGSGNVDVQSEISELRSNTASGDITVTRVAGDVTVKAASGDVHIETIAGRGRLVAASGDLTIGEALDDLSCGTASGDIRLGQVHGDLDLKAASGDATVSAFHGTSVKAKTMSGDVEIGLPAGRRVDLQLTTLSGSVKLPDAKAVNGNGDAPTVSVSAKSVSGDIRIVRLDG